RDHTLHAAIDGLVVYKRSQKDRRYVSVIPFQDVPETPVKPVKDIKPKGPSKLDPAPAPAEKPAKKAAAEAPVAEAPAAVAEAPAAETKKAAAPKKEKGPKLDDLKIIEGVGPKIETLLKEGGINTWAELAEAPVDRLKEILDAAGPRYQIHDPSTWPAQAKFAAEGKWDELKEYQEVLTGGRDKSE
ncbi:MAG: 50S ribosomal protein L27, partial [Saprospiraceae bacterium]|nr:50S ribosomal protein L27 [Saprospiraceae bacterium]